MECVNKCGETIASRHKSKCEKCKKHKFWYVVDIDEYNSREDDSRKHLKVCECGQKYVMWNRYQHEQSKHHKRYIIRRDNLDVSLEHSARICNKRDRNNVIHGRWSMARYDMCPKCVRQIVHNRPANIVIDPSNAIDIHLSNRHVDIFISNCQRDADDDPHDAQSQSDMI